MDLENFADHFRVAAKYHMLPLLCAPDFAYASTIVEEVMRYRTEHALEGVRIVDAYVSDRIITGISPLLLCSEWTAASCDRAR